MNGYRHPAYARSLAEFGSPFKLPRSDGWLLERDVPGAEDRDAMGCYPIFAAENWADLGKDLAEIGPRLVSITLVPDPFGEFEIEQLRPSFDKVVAFKEHYVVDFAGPPKVTKHHAYYARKAGAALSIEAGAPPDNFCAEWSALYELLVRRHGLKGIKAFSRAAFEVQLSIPGIAVFRAIENGSVVGAHLWYEQNGVAYSHLAAATERGYELNCSYALYSAALEYFRPRVRCMDLGAGAGSAAREGGLSWFKAGWSNSVRPAYVCGKILNPGRYEALAQSWQKHGSDYFPAYRSGELG